MSRPPVLTRTPTEEHTCTEPAGCVHPVTLRRASRRRPAAHRQPGLRAVGLDYQQTVMSPAVPQQSPPSVGGKPHVPNKLQPTRKYHKHLPLQTLTIYYHKFIAISLKDTLVISNMHVPTESQSVERNTLASYSGKSPTQI